MFLYIITLQCIHCVLLNILVLDLKLDCTHVSIMYFLQLCRPCEGRGLDVKKHAIAYLLPSKIKNFIFSLSLSLSLSLSFPLSLSPSISLLPSLPPPSLSLSQHPPSPPPVQQRERAGWPEEERARCVYPRDVAAATNVPAACH